MMVERIARYLLFQHVLENPLPWSVDRDWAHEVVASNGVVIAKCQTHEEAQAMIDMAEDINREIDDFDSGTALNVD